MALSGLDIYKLLPKTNCRECGLSTCLAFAMQLAKKAAGIDKCPYLSKESKAILESQSQPLIRLVTLGSGEDKLEIGNESVMFRHEEKFHHPCGIGFIIEDSLKDDEIRARIAKINALKFERVGQRLEVNLVALEQKGDAARFIESVKLVSGNTSLGLVLMGGDLLSLKAALDILKGRRVLIYPVKGEDAKALAELTKNYNTALVISAEDLDTLSALTLELNNLGVSDLIIDVKGETIPERIWGLTQIRRLALKKGNRNLGYPALTIVNESDPFEEAQEAATYIAKYSGIVLIRGFQPYEVLSLLTLRQNIYTDPQKPLQIEPKLYPVGQVNDKSPVLVTTNFSLSYFTVLGEVEASKIPSYIVSVDTEGMSVLTAWAAEKFTPRSIADSLNKFGVKEAVVHNRLIIPGYVAVMSGELEDESGFKVIVGPKEAAGIPAFLKNL
ncbi:MAG: acetyl-CoA decarbonylase/synthase complex subunit gamma [Candidatus Omnitrophica bacterium]|nr:acetyl-CoA decarbonylase/synthase complex subunit gamma [Candidatus Omnitrophota bacterium]MDD3987977.1 acetyl-CoA decarbonylase/synthase complex subunit gamma [Candidatus Omnitrophota bacterium]